MALVTISANVTIFLVKFLLLLLLLTSTFTALNSLFRPFRATSFLSVLSHSSYSLLSGFCSITASASLLVSGAITAIFFAFDFFFISFAFWNPLLALYDMGWPLLLARSWPSPHHLRVSALDAFERGEFSRH